MKKRLIALLAAACVCAALAGCASNSSSASSQQTITVSGSGEVEAVPDIAILRLGVETKGTTSEQARNANAQSIQSTIEAVKGLGVAEEDIQTSNIYLRPTYNESGNIDGYRMSVDMEIIVREIDKAGEVIDAAIGAGSNTLDQVSYGLSGESDLYGQALDAAVKAARLSAEKIAAAEGRKVGKMISATEYGSGMVVKPNPSTAGGNGFYENAMSADTAIMAGTDSVSAQVSVVFELE